MCDGYKRDDKQVKQKQPKLLAFHFLSSVLCALPYLALSP